MTVSKGWVPVASYSPASSPSVLSIDTSTGTKYSDYILFHKWKLSSLSDFRRIEKNSNFRFYARFYYSYDSSASVKTFSRDYTNKPGSKYSAIISLVNGVSNIAYSKVSHDSGNFWYSLLKSKLIFL